MAFTQIVAGGFGSGKSEIALNLALERVQISDEVVLADLDLVNPYFASREMEMFLNRKGVRLVAPGGDLSFGDVPNIPAEMIGLLRQENDIVIDLAGDEVGSLVLGYMSKYLISREGYDFFLVVNPYRPFAEDFASISELKNYLERAAGVSFTSIISNPNLVEETDTGVIEAGHRRVVEYADKLGLPVKYLTVEDKFYYELVPRYKDILKVIQLNLRPDWL